MPLIIERWIRAAPLGIRFWDAVMGCAIRDGLAVSAYRFDDDRRRWYAAVNRSGVYYFPSLPRLTGVVAEDGVADHGAGALGSPLAEPLWVEVVDPSGYFLPCRFAVDPPVEGLFTLACGPETSPPAPGVPLFSSPSRPVPAGMAVLRADLRDTATPTLEPAAWSIVEVQATDRTVARGMADAMGRVAVIFPYPEPQQLASFSPIRSFPGSMPVNGRRSLVDQKWPVTVRAFYQSQVPIPPIPDLCQALDRIGTNPAGLWASLSPAEALPDQELCYGQELVLRSKKQTFVFVLAAH